MITLEQHIANIRQLQQKVVENARPLFLASQSATTEMLDRIFIDGKSVSGAKFQYNDTNPLYVDPSKSFGNTSKLKPPRGKTGKTKFKSGKPHKTTYVESYKALRELVGRESSFVNFVAHGDLQSELANRQSGQITPQKVSDSEYVIKVDSKENSGKLKGLQEKYPGVFKLSNSEKSTFYKIYEKEMLLLIRKGGQS